MSLNSQTAMQRWMQLAVQKAAEHHMPPVWSQGVNPDLTTESLSGFLQD